MGITNNCAKFLFYSKSQGVDFENVLMLGRQQLYVKDEAIIRFLRQFNFPVKDVNLGKSGSYAEPLFSLLGARSVDSMDFSAYENATIIHDLNLPLPEKLRNRFSVIFDGGTLEHVFNFPVAIKNCMNALKPGGHFISITPSNNLCGHGLYQFSPELFFSIFDVRNGFETKLILLGVDESSEGIRNWYKVIDPKEVKKRVTLKNDQSTYLMVLARKITSEAIHELHVQQSDYENIWNVFKTDQSEKAQGNAKGIRGLYKRIVPGFIRDMVYRLRHSGEHKKSTVEGLGGVEADCFKKFDL